MPRIFFETAADDSRQIAGQIGTNVRDRRRVIPQNRRDQFGGRIPLEGPPSRRHLVQYDAERENIGAMVKWAARCLFGRHVGWSPHHHARLRAMV